MEKIKAIADRYKVQTTLFKVNSYLYARIFDKFTLDTVFGCIYVYENQQPGQILKMLLEKFSSSYKMPNLIFPSFHVKDNIHDKSVSIFFMGQQVAPLTMFTSTQYEAIQINQMLKFTYDAFCSLHYLHSHDTIHGNISLNTCYISKQENQIDFALNILDTSAFHEELIKSTDTVIFQSQSQQNGLKTSYKDDAQCIIYVLLHLISRGRMLSKQRFEKSWVNQNELLRWKTMDFFKQMVEILPSELEFLSEIFTIIKSLSRNQKPDYPKFIKKTYSKLKEKQNADLNIGQKVMMSGNFSMQKFSEQECPQARKNERIKQMNLKKQSRKQNRTSGSKMIEDEQEMLLNIDQDNEDNGLNTKFSKLETTKCTSKTKSFWNQKVMNQQ